MRALSMLAVLIMPSVSAAQSFVECECKATITNFFARSTSNNATDICTQSDYPKSCRIDWNAGSRDTAFNRTYLQRAAQTVDQLALKRGEKVPASWDAMNPGPQLLGLLTRGGDIAFTADFDYRKQPLVVLSGYLALVAAALEVGEMKATADVLLTAAAKNPGELAAAITQEKGSVSVLKTEVGTLSAARACLKFDLMRTERIARIRVAALAGRREELCR